MYLCNEVISDTEIDQYLFNSKLFPRELDHGARHVPRSDGERGGGGEGAHIPQPRPHDSSAPGHHNPSQVHLNSPT